MLNGVDDYARAPGSGGTQAATTSACVAVGEHDCDLARGGREIATCRRSRGFGEAEKLATDCEPQEGDGEGDIDFGFYRSCWNDVLMFFSIF